LASELKIADTSVAAALQDMKSRKMIEIQLQKDVRGRRMPAWFAAIGREYELLPKPKKDKRGAAGRAVANAAKQVAAPAPDALYGTLAVRMPKSVVRQYEEHAQAFGVTVSDVMRLALEAYAKKMGLQIASLDPTEALRRKLEGGV
jgi:hypothetical protein